MLYYWDDRDGSDFSGWWFGPRVGGDQASKLCRAQCHCIGTHTCVIFVNRYVLYVSLFYRYCSTICISSMHLYACIFCPYPSAPQSTNPSNQWLPLRCGQVWGYQPSTDTTPPESGWKVLQLKCTDLNDLNQLSNGIKKDANVCALMCWFRVIQVLEVPYDGPVDENLKVIRKKEKKEKGAKGEAVPSSSWKVQLMFCSCFMSSYSLHSGWGCCCLSTDARDARDARVVWDVLWNAAFLRWPACSWTPNAGANLPNPDPSS